MSVFGSVMTSPSKVMVPEVGSSSRFRLRRNVDLPEPDDDHFVPGVNVFGNVLENQMVAEGFAQMLNVYHFDAASFLVNFAAS